MVVLRIIHIVNRRHYYAHKSMTLIELFQLKSPETSHPGYPKSVHGKKLDLIFEIGVQFHIRIRLWLTCKLVELLLFSAQMTPK